MNYKPLLLTLIFMVPNFTCKTDPLEIAQEAIVGSLIGIGAITTGLIGYILAKYPNETKETIKGTIKHKKIIEEAIENKNNIQEFAIDKASEFYVNSLLEKAQQSSLSRIEKINLSEQINLTATALYHHAQTSNNKMQAEKFKEYGDTLYNLLPNLAVVDKKESLRNFFNSAFKGIGTSCHYLGGTNAQCSSKFSQKYATFLHRLGEISYRWSNNIVHHNGIFKKPLDNIDINNNAHLVGIAVATILTTYATYKTIKEFIHQTKKLTNKIMYKNTSSPIQKIDTKNKLRSEEEPQKKISARRKAEDNY